MTLLLWASCNFAVINNHLSFFNYSMDSLFCCKHFRHLLSCLLQTLWSVFPFSLFTSFSLTLLKNHRILGRFRPIQLEIQECNIWKQTCQDTVPLLEIIFLSKFLVEIWGTCQTLWAILLIYLLNVCYYGVTVRNAYLLSK